MENATTSPDQVASKVFWIIVLFVAGFVIAVTGLIR
jgi:hypothetical protein